MKSRLKIRIRVYHLLSATGYLFECIDTIPVANDGNTESTNILEGAKHAYEQFKVGSHGRGSESAIRSGLVYAELLMKAHRGIEADRLAIRLACDSLNYLGPGHNYTISIFESLVDDFMQRPVSVVPDFLHRYEALRYENDGEMLVINGPVILTNGIRQKHNEKLFSVSIVSNRVNRWSSSNLP